MVDSIDRISYLLIPMYWSYASVQYYSKAVIQVLLISIYRNVNIHPHARLLDYRQHLSILFVGGLVGRVVIPNSSTKNQFPLLPGSTVHTELLHRYSPVVALCTIGLYVEKCRILPPECISVIFMDLRKSSRDFPIQHQLTGSYNGEHVEWKIRTEGFCII